MKHRYILKFIALAMSVLFFSGHALAKDPVYTGFFNNTAIQGYDTVSYFQGDGVPVKGSDEFQFEWQGANWYFSSVDNMKAFILDPERYAPQYGGYCAWAAGHDTLAKGDALVYEIVGDKLYLNYNEDIGESWTAQKAELIPVADASYLELVDLE